MAEETTTPQPRRWTLAEARASAGELQDGIFLIRNEQGNWYRDPGNGVTEDRESAHRYDFNTAMGRMQLFRDTTMEFADPLSPAVVPPQPRISEVTPQPIRLTFVQLRDNLDILARKQVMMFNPRRDGGYYRAPLGTGYTPDLDLALRETCSAASRHGSACLYELVDQEAAAEILKRKCSITTILGKSLVELLQAAPMNPTGRARILAISGQMPPDTITSYDELKAWVENNYEPKTKPGSRPARPGAPPPPNGIVVLVRFREDETGTCTYSCLRQARANYEITPDVINEILAGGVYDLNDLANDVLQHIQESAYDAINPDMELGDYEHDDYECTGSENLRTDLYNGTQDLVNQLRAYLQTTQTPERLRELGIEQPTPF